ncbi:hypothetical protein PVAND_002085 [Polypedilum vanderplanki]|uniref:G-protein coupled receptors family 1 profile domain-containing protein n=1 Tax=Polypedilum vanderplanki TaxID=319348 RepID=A0A9J6BPX4_POLVA|nr:hypothetical protein PVAND_002085 [Polypedilum vanderplanki]
MDYDLETTTLNFEEVTNSANITLRLYDIFIPLLGIFIISLNLLVVISSGLLLEKRQQPRSCYILLGNLGLADMLTGIAVLFGHFYPSRNNTSCALQIGMIVSSTLVSVFSVMLVAIDRFLYISNGLQYMQFMHVGRVRILIIIAWIVGLLVGFLPAMAPSLRGTMTGEQCWFILINPELVLATTIIGIAPIFVVIILYSIILRKALLKIGELKKNATSAINATNEIETSNNLRYFVGSRADIAAEQDQDAMTAVPLQQPSNSTNLRCFCWRCSRTANSSENNNVIEGTVLTTMTPKRQQPSKWKAIKVVMFTTGSFVLTWVPYFIASTLYVYCDHEHNPNFCNGLKIAVASPLAILGFANSLTNPIIYCWWHTGFRTNSARLFARRFEGVKWCRWCFNKSNEIASSHRPPRITGNLSSTSNLSSGSARTTTTTTASGSIDVNENASSLSPHVNDLTTATTNGALVEQESFSTNL